MMNLIQYIKLWQKKRGELQIDADVNADWMEMSALLDQHMPGNAGDSGGSKQKLKPGSGPGGMSFLSTVLIVVSAAVLIYFAAKVVQTKEKPDYTKNEKPNKNRDFNSGKDSSAQSEDQKPGTDSIGKVDQALDVENKTGRDGSSVKSGDVSSEQGSAGNIKQPSDAESETARNGLSAKSSALASGQASAGNVKQPSNAEAKTEKNLSSTRSGKLKTGSDSAGNTKEYSDAESKTGSKLSAANKRTSSPINSDAGKTSSSEASAIKKASSIKKHNTADKDLNLTGNGSSTANKMARYGRRNSKKGNTGTNRPGSSHDIANENALSEPESNGLSMTNDQYYTQSNKLALLPQPVQSPVVNSNEIENYPVETYRISALPRSSTSVKTQKDKVKLSNKSFEWGVLLGANSNRSFTAKSQNHNFYGSFPVDFFTGAYVTYYLNQKWGIGTQANILSPMLVKGITYTAPLAPSKSISDSKKIYSAQFPIYATYQLTKTIGFKAGPTISFPVKEFSTYAATDSLSGSILTHSRYDQKTDYSFMGGINLRYKWITFETTYLKGLTSHSMMSDSLIHKSTNNTFQFTIKLRLGTIKQ